MVPEILAQILTRHAKVLAPEIRIHTNIATELF
jgi:hypothetical protein